MGIWHRADDHVTNTVPQQHYSVTWLIINGKLYVKPLLFKGYSANPFKLDERQFPVESSSPWKEKNTITITIPEGYSIESAPEKK